MASSESPFSQLSDELFGGGVFGGRRRFPTTRALTVVLCTSGIKE